MVIQNRGLQHMMEMMLRTLMLSSRSTPYLTLVSPGLGRADLN